MEATRCPTAPLARRQEDGRGCRTEKGSVGRKGGEGEEGEEWEARGRIDDEPGATSTNHFVHTLHVVFSTILPESLHDPRTPFVRPGS